MSLDRLLADLLAERESICTRAEWEFDRIATPCQRRIVIFGTGYLGNMVLASLRSAGIEPLAFCDNNSSLWDSRKEGIAILSPRDAVERYEGSAAFVVAIYNSSAPRRQLKELGCSRVIPYPALFWKYWRSMRTEERLELPGRVLDLAGEMPAGYALLSDEASRREFCAQIRWRCLLDYDCLPPASDSRQMYFDHDLFRLLEEEVFVDCGAFDGDSIRAFLEAGGGRFGRVYAFEADSCNRAALCSYRAGLPREIAGRLEVLPYAVGACNGPVGFYSEATAGSRLSDSGQGQAVECKTIDSALAETAPTLIKMDIEGAEPEALRGAARTMAHCRPVMAVCAYHKLAHLWEIPQLLKSANPDYRIFLRRYAEECWETVYYAVPPERLANFAPLRIAVDAQGTDARAA